MTTTGYKRIIALAFLLVAGLAGLSWHLAMKCAIQSADARGTWSTVVDFGRSRDLAFRSEPQVAAQILHQIAFLPPRRTNDSLDRIVEHERERRISEVIEYLRKRTGEDLGNDPTRWIEKYSAHEK